MRARARQVAVASSLLAVVACGPSFQAIYEGDQRFEHCYAHMFGPPNDEALRGHPLAGRGLRPYAAFEIRQSSWLRRLERMNSVHPRHDRERRAQWSAAVGVLGAINVPIVYMSVRWWRTIHQIQSSPSTVDPAYVIGLRLNAFAFLFVMIYFIRRRYEAALIERAAERASEAAALGGARVWQLPMTPERVWRAINDGNGAGSGQQ